MTTTDASGAQGQRLLQVGISLFLCALLLGLGVQRFTVPRLALSAHLLGIMQGLFLMIAGLVWPRLKLSPAAARAGFWLAVYGCLAAWMANVLAAVWGAGNSMLPMAAGPARGAPLQEAVIAVALRTGGAALIAVAVVILWGLRAGRPE